MKDTQCLRRTQAESPRLSMYANWWIAAPVWNRRFSVRRRRSRQSGILQELGGEAAESGSAGNGKAAVEAEEVKFSLPAGGRTGYCERNRLKQMEEAGIGCPET